MAGLTDDRDRVGAAYLAQLTDADLASLVRAEQASAEVSEARVRALRSEPALVLDTLDRPATSAGVLALGAPSAGRQFSFVSPFLVFAAAVHRTAADLTHSPYAPERAAPRLRVPVFDAADLTGYLADPSHRLFLIGLLASFARVQSGVTVTRTGRGLRRRRWSELDPLRLAELLEAMPQSERPALWQRLGDVALFLTGVFPDAAARSANGQRDVLRLLRLTGVRDERVPEGGSPELLEWLGPRWYRLAAEHASGPGAAGEALRDAADHFRQARRVLNSVTDRYLFPISSDWFSVPS